MGDLGFGREYSSVPTPSLYKSLLPTITFLFNSYSGQHKFTDGNVRLDINSSPLLFLAFHFLYLSCFIVTFFCLIPFILLQDNLQAFLSITKIQLCWKNNLLVCYSHHHLTYILHLISRFYLQTIYNKNLHQVCPSSFGL